MPSYKTHSIHGELVLPYIDRRIEINKEDIKTFCIGPDTMIATNYKLFEYQHENKVKEYFECLLKLIKENKLQDNSEVMAFVYGQLDHYVLDIIMHPLIYYGTQDLPKTNIISPHSIVEMWIDDYTIKKFDKNDIMYYQKTSFNSNKLKDLINNLYQLVYNDRNVYLKYDNGMRLINLFDLKVRRNLIKIAPFLIKLLNLGDIIYHKDTSYVESYLNLENDIWYDPETGEKHIESFDELWKNSIEVSSEIIEDVNKCLYLDKQLNNRYISNDISYSTGLSCEKGQSYQYIKKY